MQQYSTPMTPPPTMIMVFGRLGRFSTWSELTIVVPLMGTFGELAGFVPVAMMTFLPSYTVWPRVFVTFTCVGSSKLATPVSTSTLLRESCASVTSISVLITCCTRKARSAIVIRSFTR